MSTNPHDFVDPHRQGQYPPPQLPPSQWTQPEDHSAAAAAAAAAAHHYPPVSQYPYPPASYPPPAADHPYAPPPTAQYPPTSMAALHPHVQGPPQDPYRLPPPGAYRPGDVYAQQPAHPPPQVVYQAAAPRQRTAIACRYCRRRKIRCSGFESSHDGRCSNCIRFNQECMFTPVSSQAQAFVPAHAAYPHLRNAQSQGRPTHGVMLYGAHGQPLPPQQQPPGPELPPPHGMYQPYGAAPPPLASPLPPDQQRPGRRSSGSGFEYPDPTNLAPVTPAASTPGYQAHTAPSPYYPPPTSHERRPSPQSAYPYDGRHSSSPHTSPYPPMQPSQGAMTPPPTSTPTGSSRGGLNVRDMLNPGDSQGRSSTDSDMLNALNRRGLNQ